MDRRCAAGALLALAACIATTAAAPTASNQTALDLYEGASEGCYYNFQHYGEGDRIMTNEPCLNCTCHNRMLMCYLRVCPFTKPIGQDCSVEKRADQCCPIVTCPDVPVDLLTSTSTSSPSEYGETGLGKLDRYGCSINGKYFPEGSKVPPSPNKPCEHCYCIRNMTTCVMQECTLHVDGCTPIYRKDVCCPVRYSCDHPEDEIPLLDDMTTTVRPTPGFLLTTTTLAPVTQMTQDCVHDDNVFADGALIKTEKACEHCYCMKGDIVCVVQECGTPMENEGKNCTSMPPREGQCCPDTYICEGDEMTTETKPDIATETPFEDITTLSPPRRVSIEGSGYRSETDEPSTEVSILEPETEGSGEDQPPFKPTDVSDMLIPETETSPPLIVTDKDEVTDNYSPSATEVPDSESKMTERTTTEADKGENTVPSGDVEEDSSDVSTLDKSSPEAETTTTKLEVEKESSFDAKTTVLPEDETSMKDQTTPHEGITATEPVINELSTIADKELHISPDTTTTSSDGLKAETTIPTRRKDDEIMPKETTTLKHLEESTTKSNDLIAPAADATESSTSSGIEEEIKTTTSQYMYEDKEVKQSTTESHVEPTTEFEVKTETPSATTVQLEIATEFTTPGKVEFSDTTSANPIENEIDEDSFPTLAPGRIPGEGDCLLDGVTYSHESIVPSSSNCHTSCKCLSSIVKCEPVVCSPPPDYMDNCQPMYDSPESCCPTYVCDHPRETVPPQSHSQMAGTESPIPTPTIECDGDQCEIIKDKEETQPSVPCTSEGCIKDSSLKPDECGPQGCGEVEHKPEEAHPVQPVQCAGDSCSPPSDHCASGKCEAPVPKDQTCNNENGCDIPVIQTCQGDDCAIEPAVTSSNDTSTNCANPDGCKDQTVIQTCQGNDCGLQPDSTPSKDDSTHCGSPDGCKGIQTEKAPDCQGESCISELPPKVIPQEAQDCIDGNDCGQSSPQPPAVGECTEQECKTQQIPDIKQSYPSDCIGNECTQQQDHKPHVTDLPELGTESAPGVTELPEELNTKSEKPVTELPKTTAFEKETEPSATTKASITAIEEESDITGHDDEIDKNKEIETTSTISVKPEIVTQAPKIEQEASSTEKYKQETTIVPLPEVTPAVSEVQTTQTPSFSDKDTKDITTESPGFVETESTEQTTNPTDDVHSEVPEEDAKDKETIDITSTEAAILSASPKITQETTQSPEILTLAPENLDRDGHENPTKEPEYVQDTDEKLTESTERYTSAPEQTTDKVEVEPVQEHESQGTPTTPKSYESQTTTSEGLEQTSPEMQTALSQDEDKIRPELPVSTSTPEEPVTGVPDDTKQSGSDKSTPDTTTDKIETKAPEFIVDESTFKPLDLGTETQTPEFNVTPGVESVTQTPVPDIPEKDEIQTVTPTPLVTLPQESSGEETDIEKHVETPPPVIVDVQTQTPMSIVKDHGDDDIGSGVTTELMTTERITSEPESPEITQSSGPTAKPSEMPSEEPVSDIGKMPSVSDEKDATTTVEPSSNDLGTPTFAVNVLPTKQPGDESDKTVSVPISSEQSTESIIHESSVPQEETSEIAPITSTLSDDMETKSPTTATESSAQPVSEGEEAVTPVQEQPDNELPELIVHEHPTEPSLAENETEQPATENTGTKEPQEITPEKETSGGAIPQDAVTVSSEIPESVTQKEATVEADEFATKAPEFSQPETTELTLDRESHIPEPQNEGTESPELQATTKTPELTATGAQKEATETPAIQATVTSAPEVSQTEPQETITEAQPPVTESDVSVTQLHEDTTDAPVSNDMVTTPSESSDTATDPHNQSPAVPEEPEIEPHKETTKVQDITTEISPHKESTETSTMQDTVTMGADISPEKSDNEAAEEPTPQDAVTIAPELFTTETQEEPTKTTVVTDEAANVPGTSEIVPKEESTEAPVAQNKLTNAPEAPITESVPKEDTNIPVMEEKVTTVPEVSVTETPKEGTEAPTDVSSSDVPELHATEPQKYVTEAPDSEDTVTNVAETLITESHRDTQPESQYTETSSSELPETEPKKETTETPEPDEAGSTIPETPETEPKKEMTEMPEVQGITDAPEISADTKAPEITDTESQKRVTKAPETQDVVTNGPIVPTVIANEVTETQESSEKTEPSEPAEILTTESQKPATEVPEISSETVTNASEMLTTKSDTDVKNAPEQEFTTTTTELVETESKPEKSPVTEKDESVTEPPLKITTKFDDHTQHEPQEFVTSTESSKIESETLLTTEGGSLIESDTKVTEPVATEHPDKTDSAETEKPAPTTTADEEKPHDGHDVDKETPFVEPAHTQTPVAESNEPETKAPELIDTEPIATATPELSVTEKQDSRRTESTSAPIEEDATRAPEILETQDKTTKIPQVSELTPKEETTPYLVILEEHTHKSVSPDAETSTSPSDVIKEYEPSTPDISEISIDKVTESAPSGETEKLPQEDSATEKELYVPETTQTILDKSTEALSEELTTISPLPGLQDTEKPQIVESNEISTSAPSTGEEPAATEKPLELSVESETEKEAVASEKPQETMAPEEEFILATTKATTIKAEEESTSLSPLLDKFGKPDDETSRPVGGFEKPKPEVIAEVPKPGVNEVQPTEEALPEEEAHFPPSGTSGYGQEPDYGEEDSFGPGTCRYGGKVYVSAQQIPRDDPCDFCFCFRSDIICLQQSCPPPIHGCHEEPIQGFCCPRYECPVSMATTLNVTTTTTTTTTTLPPHFLPHAYKGAAQRKGCQIKGHTYKVGEVVRASSGPCLHCTCGGDGQMKCDPKVCTPEPMLRQMIAAAVSAKRRR